MVINRCNTEMDIVKVRRENLNRLVERDTLSSVAIRVGKPASQLKDMLAGRKSFGEKVTRQIEKRYAPDLPQGWLDKPDDALPNPPAAIELDSATFHVLDVKAACGNGHHNHDYPETVRTLIMSPEEAQRLIGSQNKHGAIQVILASKDSMAPAIQPDDLLFVDTSIKDYIGEAVYILLHGDELVCKRISLVGRELTVSSDNKAYPSWPWHERPEETKIIGKVIKALPMSFKKFGAV